MVTLWYVIEHFPSLDFLWDLIPKILNEGGVLAFSTPSFSGLSGKKDIKKFLEASPKDHYFIINPKISRTELKARGFTDIRIKSTGIHPERAWPKLPRCLRGIIAKCCSLLEKGDTFECYAVLEEKKIEK